MGHATQGLPGDLKYRIRSTGASSARFGACEVCETHVSEVFIQVESKAFAFVGDPTQIEGWARTGCLFGHEACLISKRKGTP